MSARLHGDWEFLSDKIYFPSSFFFFLSKFFHCISLAAEDHSWPPQSSRDKIFSHFSIPGLFNQPLLTWPLCCFSFHAFGDLRTSFFPFPWSWELRQCLAWQDSRPRGQRAHVWSTVSELYRLNLPMSLASLVGRGNLWHPFPSPLALRKHHFITPFSAIALPARWCAHPNPLSTSTFLLLYLFVFLCCVFLFLQHIYLCTIFSSVYSFWSYYSLKVCLCLVFFNCLFFFFNFRLGTRGELELTTSGYKSILF